MARRVEKGHLRLVGKGHLIGADMLGDAAGFSGNDIGPANGVEQ